jgi:L-fuconolactonase
MGHIVDASVHIFPVDAQGRTVPPASGSVPAGAEGATAEELLGHMRQAGVHQALLVPPTGYDNSYFIETAQRYPASFSAIGRIDVDDPDAGSTLDWLTAQPGICGVRFEPRNGRQSADWLDAPQTIPLWQEAARKHISVSLPVVRGMDQIPPLRRVLETFPTVPVVLRRMLEAPIDDGPPYTAAKDFLGLGDFPNVYSTFSHLNVEDAKKGKSTVEAFFETLIGRFGASRLIWSTYFPTFQAAPNAPVKGLIDYVREQLAFLPEDELDLMLGETARRIFPALRHQSG